MGMGEGACPLDSAFSSPEFLAPITQANLVCVTVLNILKYAEKTDVSKVMSVPYQTSWRAGRQTLYGILLCYSMRYDETSGSLI